MQARHCRMIHERWLSAVCISDIICLTSRWIIVSRFPPRFLNRDADLCLYASAVSEPRQFFVACEDCAARLALSLSRRLDNRVSSSSALSEARLIFLRSLSLYIIRCCNFMRVLSLNWNYGMCSARYIEKSLPDVRLGWLAPARQLGECMALLASESDPTAYT